MLAAGGARHELTLGSSYRVKKNPEENRKMAHAAAATNRAAAMQAERMPSGTHDMRGKWRDMRARMYHVAAGTDRLAPN